MKLIRDDESGGTTRGTLVHDDGTVQCQTLELPWVDTNQDGVSDRNVSRIPAGHYTVTRRYSPSHGYDVFWIDGVPGRGAIEIHAGNTVKDIKGCVALGTERGTLDGLPAVLHSKQAFAEFMQEMASVNVFPLDVVDPVAT